MEELMKLGDLPTEVPEYLQTPEQKAAAREGSIDDDGDLLKPPRLKLLQGTSGEVTDGLATAGQFWSTHHLQVMGGLTKQRGQNIEFDDVFIIPLRWAKEFMWFTDDNKLAWRTTNPEDERLTALGEEAFKAKTLHLLCVVGLGKKGIDPAPVILTFGGMSHKVGQNFYQEMTMRPTASYTQIYKLGIRQEERNSNKFWVPTINFAGFTPAKAVAEMQEFFQNFASYDLTPEMDMSDSAAPATSAQIPPPAGPETNTEEPPPF